jgi:hypothetical protein
MRMRLLFLPFAMDSELSHSFTFVLEKKFNRDRKKKKKRVKGAGSPSFALHSHPDYMDFLSQKRYKV